MLLIPEHPTSAERAHLEELVFERRLAEGQVYPPPTTAENVSAALSHIRWLTTPAAMGRRA